jgi:DNA-3-methyladenine glycosylase II
MMIHLTTLKPTPPYNFDLLLDVLSRFAHPTLDVIRDGAYWRVIRDGIALALVRVTSRGSVASPALDVHLMGQIGEADPAAVIRQIEHILHTDAGRGEFVEIARGDEALWQVVEPLVGLPEWRTATMFEALMQTIIEQQIAWTTAQKAQRWLVEWAGDAVGHNSISHYAFPTPGRLAIATVDDLKPLKITFKRMALMIDLAVRITSGELDLERLEHEPPETAYQHLLAIKGIGHWTAAVTLERAFGHKDWVAYNDVVLQAATNRYFYGGVGRIPPQLVTDTFARYGEYAGLAAHYTMIRWVRDQYPVREGLRTQG